MGDVWEATNVSTGRAVAIKRLRLAPGADLGDSGRARFMLEAQTACAVEHPNVVEILDFVESGEEPPIIVMELLRGETLAERVEREQALGVTETATLLLPVVSAVGTAHARGIVHRDLKPANIFLQQSGATTVVKVLDFGIAKWLGARPGEVPLRTETGSTLGTPCYMAPEQAMGERVIDHRADVWALGVILYECLSGMRPVEGENAAKIMVRLLSTGIMPIEKLVPAVPRELGALLMRMLARERAQRPPSLREVRAVLGALTAAQAPDFGEPEVELATSETFTLPVPSTSAPVTRPAPTAGERRRKLVPVGVGALALVGLAGAVLGLRPAAKPTEERAAAASPAGTALANPYPAPAPEPVAATPTSALAVAGSASAAVARAPSAATTASVAAVPAAPDAPRVAVGRAKRSERGPSPDAAGKPSAAMTGATVGLAAGAACERSRDCASQLCLAFVCK